MIKADEELCLKDRLCNIVCPSGIISVSNDGYPYIKSSSYSECIYCGHCISVCSQSALSHKKLPLEKTNVLDNNKLVNFEKTKLFLMSRRSVRKYRKKKIPRESIINLLNIASYAPSGHNINSVKWLVIEKNKLKVLAKLTIEWMYKAIEMAPDIAKIFGIDSAIRAWENGKDPIFHGAPSVFVAYSEKSNLVSSISSIIAISYVELASLPLGLGTCWLGYFLNAATMDKNVKKELSLTRKYQVNGAISIGYSKYKFKRIPYRRSANISWI